MRGDNGDVVGDGTVHWQDCQLTWQCLIIHTEILQSLLYTKGVERVYTGIVSYYHALPPTLSRYSVQSWAWSSVSRIGCGWKALPPAGFSRCRGLPRQGRDER